MTQEEKLEAIWYMVDKDSVVYKFYLDFVGFKPIWKGINDGFCSEVYLDLTLDFMYETNCVHDDRPTNQIAVDMLFEHLARLTYLKKKIEFSKQPRNSKGQFIKRDGTSKL